MFILWVSKYQTQVSLLIMKPECVVLSVTTKYIVMLQHTTRTCYHYIDLIKQRLGTTKSTVWEECWSINTCLTYTIDEL